MTSNSVNRLARIVLPLCIIFLLTGVTAASAPLGDGQRAASALEGKKERARLQVDVSNIHTDAKIGESITFPVKLRNKGDVALTNVQLYVDGGYAFSSFSTSVPSLNPNQRENVDVTIDVYGRSSKRPIPLYLTLTADELLTPVQEKVQINFSRLDSFTKPGYDVVPLEEQQVRHATFSGSILDVDVTTRRKLFAASSITTPLTLDLDYLLLGAAITGGELSLDFTSAAGDILSIPFLFDAVTQQLTYTPIEEGTYTVGIESASSTVAEPPARWVPTFHEPVVSQFMGSVSYSYPIVVPPGSNGLQPALALSYSSAAANGVRAHVHADPVGFGWNLAGRIDIVQSLGCLPGCTEAIESGELTYNRYHLTINGAGYELTHVGGESSNGAPGRYYLEGNGTIYAEYCKGSGRVVCTSADDGDSIPGNGRADGQESGGFWIVKTGNDTTYRLGYTSNSEQEVYEPYQHADLDNPALKWRVDRVRDRFDNEMLYAYEKIYVQGGNADTRILTPASYLASIDYGYGSNSSSSDGFQIDFVYDVIGTGFNEYYGTLDGKQALGWQVRYLTNIEIKKRSNNAVLKSYELEQLWQRYGQQSVATTQSPWCSSYDQAEHEPNMPFLPVLTNIYERDANGNEKDIDSPEITFAYRYERTAYANPIRFCYPLMTQIYTLYGPASSPTAQFDYYHINNLAGGGTPFKAKGDEAWTTQNINVVEKQTLLSGSPGDAPDIETFFQYEVIHQDFQGVETAFQGFTQMSVCRGASCESGNYETKTTVAFEVYPHDSLDNTLTGKVKQRTTYDASGAGLTEAKNSWTRIGAIRQAVNTKVEATDLVYGRISKTEYSYWASTGQRLTEKIYNDGSVVRIIKTDYDNVNSTGIINGTSDIWLVDMPWQISLYAGSIATSNLSARVRYRYDDAPCSNAAKTATTGLLTATDAYIPGNGNSTICGSDWQTTRYYYGGANNGSTSVGNGAGQAWQLTSVVDPGGSVSSTTWATHTLLASTENSDGITSVAYNNSNLPWLVTTVTFPNGSQSRYSYDTFGRVVKVSPPGPANGGHADDAYGTTYTYADGQFPFYIEETTAPGTGIYAKSRTFYDAIGRPLQERQWHLSSDFDKTVVDIEYDSLGRQICQSAVTPVSSTAFGSSNCESLDHTLTQYDALGRAVSAQAFDGSAVETFYGDGALYSHNANQQISASFLDDLGRLTAVDEFDVTFDDTFANLTNWTVLGSGVSTSTNYVKIYTTGNWSEITRVESIPNDEDASALFSFYVDDTDDDGTVAAQIFFTSGTWNTAGFRIFGLTLDKDHIKVLEWEGDSSVSNATEIPVLPLKEGAWYRALIRTSRSVGKEFAILVWEVGDPANMAEYRVAKPGDWHFDAWRFAAKSRFGTELRIRDYGEAAVYRTLYGYDAQDNLSSVIDAANNLTTISYNVLGQKVQMNDPDMGLWTYAYDKSGNLTRQTDNNNQRLCFYYDTMNRMTSKWHRGTGKASCPGASNSTGAQLASYVYYDSGPGLGLLHQVTTAHSSDTYTYDFRGRVTQQVRLIEDDDVGAQSFNLATTYDLYDRPLEVTYPNGENVETAYDLQFPQSLKVEGQTLVANLDYNHRGQLEFITRGLAQNGETLFRTDYKYFGSGDNFRLKQIIHGATHSDYRPDMTYAYDDVGNIIQIVSAFNSGSGNVVETQNFSYDSLDRLVSAQANGGIADYSERFEYSAIGNLTKYEETLDGTVWNYEYNDTAHIHAVTAVNGIEQTFYYDANGNMTERKDTTGDYSQQYDVENRLMRVTDNATGESTRFFYDADGSRIKTVHPDGAIIFTPFPSFEREVRPGSTAALDRSLTTTKASLFSAELNQSSVQTLPIPIGLMLLSTMVALFFLIRLWQPRAPLPSSPLLLLALGIGLAVAFTLVTLAQAGEEQESSAVEPEGKLAGQPRPAVPNSLPNDAIIYLSPSYGNSVDGISYTRDDILAYDTISDSWSLFLDGSAVGIPTNADIYGVVIQSNGKMLLTFLVDNITLPGIATPVDNSDIVEYDPALNTFSLYFDGSDVGLTTSGESIDALAIDPSNGNILFSPQGGISVSGLSAADEDIIAFSPLSLGEDTSGSFSLYFDGSDVGLSNGGDNEDIRSVWVDAGSGDIYLNTKQNFSVSGASGDKNTIFICTPTSLGSTTACNFTTYLDTNTIGMTQGVYALHLAKGGVFPTVTPTSTPAVSNTATPTSTSTTTTTATPTSTAPSGGGSSTTFTVEADAFTKADNPTQNTGGWSYMRADSSPIRNAYLRFDVRGLSGSVSSATLRLYATDSSSAGVSVWTAANNWKESGSGSITYNNAPNDIADITDSGPISANSWVEIDVTDAVSGNGQVSFKLVGNSSVDLDFDSRTNSSGNAAELVVVTSGGPTATATHTPAATATATHTPLPGSTATATNTPSASSGYSEDFEGYGVNQDPSDWYDSIADNKMAQDDSLFKTASVGGTMAFGTTSTDPNIHSHYVGGGAPTSGYRYSGRLYITSAGSGIGVTFYSDYPNGDVYYRLRRFGTGNNASFHLASHGATVEGTHDTGVVPGANTWYRFLVEVENVTGGTAVRAKVWQDGTSEPSVWQVNTTDDSDELTSGTFGLWAYLGGSKYWDDLTVVPLSGTPPQTATPTKTPTATATPVAPPPPPEAVTIDRVTYMLAGQPIAVRITGDPESSNNGLFFHALDHLGSVMVLSRHTNGDVDLATRSFYAPFGARRFAPSDGLITEGYTGHKHNDNLGLIYMNARYYVPGIGRFASADTIIPNSTHPQSYNRYTYALNSPIEFVDPTGYFSEDAIQNYIWTMCGDSWSCFDTTLEEWQSNSEWWELLIEAQAGDVIFGHSHQNVFHTFSGVGKEKLSGIYLSDPYGNRIDSSNYEISVARNLSHSEVTLSDLAKWYNTPIGFIRWENGTPSFSIPTGGNMHQKVYPTNGNSFSWGFIPGYAKAQDIIAEMTFGAVSLIIPEGGVGKKIAAIFGATALDEFVEPTNRFRDATFSQPGDVHVYFQTPFGNYNQSTKLAFRQVGSKSGYVWNLNDFNRP